MAQHMMGGTLRRVMANEVRRVMSKYAGAHNSTQAAAKELGITTKSLRKWKGPIEKGGWMELQPTMGDAMDRIVGAFDDRKKKHKK